MAGGFEQLVTDADCFGLEFPHAGQIPVEHKALLLGVFKLSFWDFDLGPSEPDSGTT
eukprot:SAG22_NODE_1233_length_5065_cov_12.050141_4_plen_57_part_00